MTIRSLQEALEETLGCIERAVARIEHHQEDTAELHNLRAYLLNILELVERDPGIDAASDDLYSAAQAFAAANDDQAAHDFSPRRPRLLKEALFRFQVRLAGARPSERARQMGLT
jgi:hypothetical protein